MNDKNEITSEKKGKVITGTQVAKFILPFSLALTLIALVIQVFADGWASVNFASNILPIISLSLLCLSILPSIYRKEKKD